MTAKSSQERTAKCRERAKMLAFGMVPLERPTTYVPADKVAAIQVKVAALIAAELSK